MHQFCELLPAVKTEFDSFENEVETFETLGSDPSVIKKLASTSARVDLLESGVTEILDLDSVRRSRHLVNSIN